MKIIRLFVLLGAIAVLGGCASAHITEEDMALERESKYQTIEHNQIVNDNDCISADAAAKANALASVSPTATSPQELSGLQYEVYRQQYDKLKPDCVRGKQGAAETGGRYNVTPEELARMPLAAQCEYASSLMLMLMSNETRNVDHEVASPRSSVHYLKEVVWPDCQRRQQQIREAREYQLREKEIEERHKTRFSDFFCPWGYRSRSCVVNVGIGWENRYRHSNYRGSPSESRRNLWEKAGYRRYDGQHRHIERRGYRRLDTWKY